MAERNPKRIIRQWDREIEDEIRRRAERDGDERRWRVVVWTSLWFLWLVALVGLLSLIKPLR